MDDAELQHTKWIPLLMIHLLNDIERIRWIIRLLCGAHPITFFPVRFKPNTGVPREPA